MKIQPRSLAKTIREGRCALWLLHGADAGGVAETADRILGVGSGREVLVLDAADVARNPTPLHEAAASYGLFAADRAIRIRDGADRLTKALSAFLPGHDGRVPLVVEAGELAARSSLRKLFEADPNAAAALLPEPDAAALARLADGVAKEAGQRLAPAARDLLVDRLPRDSAAARRELEKLAIYADGRAEIGADDIDAAIGDGAAADLDEAVLAAASGQVVPAQRALRRLLGAGRTPIEILRALLRHLGRLHRARAAVDAGLDPKSAAGQLKPPVFWKQQDAFLAQLRFWSADLLEKSIDRADDAEAAIKRSGHDPDSLVLHLFWEVSLQARAAARKSRR